MGRSPTANVFYGFAFEGENTWPWEDDDYEKWEAFRDHDWDEEHFFIHNFLGKTEAEINAMEWKERSELFKSCQVKVGRWGYSEEPSYFICPKDTKACVMGTWDGATSLNPKNFETNPEWDAVLTEYCEKMGIDTKGKKPGWTLVVSDD